MSSALSQQLKWFSFLILFLIIYLQLPSPAICGLCQFQCLVHRPTRYDAYTLNCNKSGLSEADIADCIDTCKHCSASICNPSTPHIFHCPAIDLNRCEKHCDDNRPSGSTSAYTLDCQKRNQSKAEVDKCISLCDLCTFEICDTDAPNIFNCPAKINPSSSISDRCKEHCDTIRKDEFPYSLDCLYVDDYFECANECSFCPKQVCHPYDTSIFNCPKGSSVCELRCNRNRPKGSTSAYTHTCNDTRNVCENDCRLCSQICSIKDPFKFKCPAKGTRVPTAATTTTGTTTTTKPTSTKPPTYKGPCENRCNSKRPKGSTGAYKLRCKTAYKKQDEIVECNKDCKRFCPSTICFRPGEYNCPALKELEPVPPQTKEEAEDKQLSTVAAVAIIVVILLLVLGGGGYAYFVFGRKKAKNQVKPEKEVEGLFEFARHDEEHESSPPPDTSERSSSSVSKSDSFLRFSFGSASSSKPNTKRASTRNIKKPVVTNAKSKKIKK